LGGPQTEQEGEKSLWGGPWAPNRIGERKRQAAAIFGRQETRQEKRLKKEQKDWKNKHKACQHGGKNVSQLVGGSDISLPPQKLN